MGVQSKATESTRSRIKNLSECDFTIDFMSLVDVIGHQFYKEAGVQVMYCVIMLPMNTFTKFCVL